jgi:DNA replication and repair protein RecF
MINRILLKNFRNYPNADCRFSKKINVFTGRNGQGKSNLLEAIFFLCTLRSFRTAQIRDLRTIGQKNLAVCAEIKRHEWTELLEIEVTEEGQRRLKIDGKSINRASEFVKIMKAVAFAPNDITIINGSSIQRRRFMDMFISMMEPEYLTALHEYSLALKSRNAALKSHRNLNVARAFEPTLAANGSFIITTRIRYSHILEQKVEELLRLFFTDTFSFQIKYRHYGRADKYDKYLHYFEQEREKELRRGYGAFGPHLDDFDFNYNDKILRTYGSTGQCRLTALCLKMAEVNLFAETTGPAGIIVLVDDVTGELDVVIKSAFFKVINQAGQIFFTFTEAPKDEYFNNASHYHIENGHCKTIPT